MASDRPVGAGTVAIVADLAARYTVFSVSLQRLVTPPETVVMWHLGSDVAANRNRACEQLSGEWVWFIDDDHAFHPDILSRLLVRDVPIVQPLCLRRGGNFLPVACKDDDHLNLADFAPDELVEVQHCGSSGMLVRREVIDAIEPPWFELRNGISEDVVFCEKARAAGFSIHVDLAARLGHVTTAVVWPTFRDEGWMTGFQFADGFEVAADITAAYAEGT